MSIQTERNKKTTEENNYMDGLFCAKSLQRYDDVNLNPRKIKRTRGMMIVKAQASHTCRYLPQQVGIQIKVEEVLHVEDHQGGEVKEEIVECKVDTFLKRMTQLTKQ